MSSEIAVKGDGAIAPVSRNEMIAVMARSLYPGAAPESIALVLDYCAAARLDPMQKPVHIVAMWDSKAKCMRDTILPGIGLYRIQAARTGQYAGMSEPVFGPTITAKIGGVDVTYPEWCRITVKRIVGNVIAEFPAVEYWVENYAMKGGAEKSVAPNSMWCRRSFGQLAKCAEAQALRKAFPEVGSALTAEEMEGKSLDERDVMPTKAEIATDPNAERRAELVKKLEAAARTNGATLKAEWAEVKSPDRVIVGTAEWERIKKLVVPTKTEDAKPSYAVLLDQINAAPDADALGVILGDITHLPAEQQAELMDAAKHRMEGM